MIHKTSKLQGVLYRVFLATCTIATILGLLAIWGFVPMGEEGVLLARLTGTCIVVAVASALTMSATRLVAGRPPEDDIG